MAFNESQTAGCGHQSNLDQHVSAAQEAVGHIALIVENILRFVPMKPLLLWQRVSREWKHIITASKELQQALYFESAEPEYHLIYDRPVEKLTKVPAGASSLAISPLSIIFNAAILNPMIFHQDCEYTLLQEVENRDGRFQCWGTPAGSYRYASWRRMLVSQPPIFSADIRIRRFSADFMIRTGRELEAIDITKAHEYGMKVPWHDVIFSSGGTIFLTEKQVRMDEKDFQVLVGEY